MEAFRDVETTTNDECRSEKLKQSNKTATQHGDDVSGFNVAPGCSIFTNLRHGIFSLMRSTIALQPCLRGIYQSPRLPSTFCKAILGKTAHFLSGTTFR